MKPIILLIILYIAEVWLSPAKRLRYRNVNAVVAAFWIFVFEFAVDILTSVLNPSLNSVDALHYFIIIIQAAILVGIKLYFSKQDTRTRYGIPARYTNGWRQEFISGYYDFEKSSPVVYIKNQTFYLGIIAMSCSVILTALFTVQSYIYTMSGNTLFLPFSTGGLVSLLVEFGMFCMGESLWKRLLSQYRRRRGCSNRRELARARFSEAENYSYIFMKNFVWEPLHISHATKFNWKQNVENSVTYYNFEAESKSDFKHSYKTEECNASLESFIADNGLEVNGCYVTAYNLIERNQNVILKTPSYVDFEPYFTAAIKMKVAQTQKVVLIVSNEEKKLITINKLKSAFNEYFGFREIPVISTINEYAEIEAQKRRDADTESEKQKKFYHFNALSDYDEAPDDIYLPVKSPDVVVLAPEDVCDPEYSDCIRSIIKKIGLIVYYDFSECVQEEALFARIVHSVLDSNGDVSTLYMTDGFFDLEQVVDNFFSKRDLYEVVVPRMPAAESYITGWKAENIYEMQSRTDPDASRNIGNHIPILYDATSHTENDLIIVEDEYDTYAENFTNFSAEAISARFNCHVGWTDVIGGTSVICSVSDTYNNAAHAYRAMAGVGNVSEYINIISRPYLLRNYIMYNLRYFAMHPRALSNYTPGVIKTARSIAYEALVKAYVVGCTEEQLAEYAARCLPDCSNNPEHILRELVSCADSSGELEPIVTKDVFDRYYIDEATYRAIIDKSALVEKIEFVNNEQVILRNKRDYSYLIPHQKIILNGVKYTVENIKGNRIELTDSNTREPVPVSRTIRSCIVNVKGVEAYGNLVQNASKSSLSFKRLISDVEMDVYGNIAFKDSYHPFSSDQRFDYHKVLDTQHRKYSDVNVFCIKIGSAQINSGNKGKFAHMLASLINEMLPTFFPRLSERVVVGCSDWTVDSCITSDDISIKYIVAQMNINVPEPLADNEICLYVLEDSPIETGLINVFWQDEEFRNMLIVLEDYLYFQEVVRQKEHKEIFDGDWEYLYALRNILKEVCNETYEDYDGASGKFEGIYFNRIRRSRNKFNSLNLHNNFELTCDFCGKKIQNTRSGGAPYHFYAYSGMISCMDCYSVAVCSEKASQETIEAYKGMINHWFNQMYKETVDNVFYNYLEDAERVTECAVNNHPMENRYITTDDRDYGSIYGLSCSVNTQGNLVINLNEEYIASTNQTQRTSVTGNDIIERASYVADSRSIPYILIRDGLPFKEYMGTLCHEMTHQWQYWNLNRQTLMSNTPSAPSNEFGKSVDLSVYRIEGHAEWERIRYLKNHGAYRLAMKEIATLNASVDAYGLGYKWMCRMMRVGGDDPNVAVVRDFKFVLKRTFYQITKNSFALMRLYFGGEKAKSEDTTSETATTDTTTTTETVTTDIETTSDTDNTSVTGNTTDVTTPVGVTPVDTDGFEESAEYLELDKGSGVDVNGNPVIQINIIEE